MDIEILFLDGDGKFRCAMRSGFPSSEAAMRYARSVMRTRFCRHYASAEIYGPDSLLLAAVLNESNSRLLDLRGHVRQNTKPVAPMLKPMHATVSPGWSQLMTGTPD